MIKTKYLSVLTVLVSLLMTNCIPSAADMEAKIKRELRQYNDSVKAANRATTTKTIDKQSEVLPWNYFGTIGNIKIKAQINYEEGTHAEGSGALQIPISGYYFYESQNAKMLLEGTATGTGLVSIVAYTNGGKEYFEGEYQNGEMLKNFAGTWSKDGKELPFKLYSK